MTFRWRKSLSPMPTTMSRTRPRTSSPLVRVCSWCAVNYWKIKNSSSNSTRTAPYNRKPPKPARLSMTVHEFPLIAEASEEASTVTAAIDAAARRLRSLQHTDGHWCGELEGDTILESEYLLLLYYLGRSGEERFRNGAEYIRRQQ